MKFYILIIYFLICTPLLAKTPETHCYESATFGNFVITQKITPSKNGRSLYEFNINSLPDSVGPIHAIEFISMEMTDNIKGPPDWNIKSRTIKADDGMHVRWSGYQHSIYPGQNLTGFQFEGASKNGVVPLKISNFYTRKTRRTAKLSDIPIPKKSVCPGSWYAGSTTKGDKKITSMILAPISSNRVSPTILIKKANNKTWTGAITQEKDLITLSPLDKGKIKLLVEGTNEFNVEDIDLGSLEFGRVKAKALTHRFISPKKIGLLHSQTKSFTKTKNALELEFDLAKLNIVCELDQALFLSGKLKNGKELVSGVKIKPVKCTPETFAKEAAGVYKIKQELEAMGNNE